MKKTTLFIFWITLLSSANTFAQLKPLMTVVDIGLNEEKQVTLCDGSTATVKLLEITAEMDSFGRAIRKAQASVEINGQKGWLEAGNYNLPKIIGAVQVDCAITSSYLSSADERNIWALENDARLRLWPVGSPLIKKGTFIYPVKQKWFASSTQMANEPCYVNACDDPKVKDVYYHYGLDFGGAESLIEVVAATAGTVVSACDKTLEGMDKDVVQPRYDVVYICDSRNWYYRYSHMNNIDKSLKPGDKVKIGQHIGFIGKEGGSGGWTHLHFHIMAKQPNGKYGITEAYPLVWQAYKWENNIKLQAIARPHNLVMQGEKVILNGWRSFSEQGPAAITSYQWILSDGRKIKSPSCEVVYNSPGMYSEVLKITDNQDRVSYDIMETCVLSKDPASELAPTIHATYACKNNPIHPKDVVTFKVRSFKIIEEDSFEIWDFGDGSKKIKTHSDGNAEKLNPNGYAITTHAFKKPGDYIVTVSRTNKIGWQVTAKLIISVKK